MDIITEASRTLRVSTLIMLTACAPSLASQVSSVRTLARSDALPALREGVIEVGMAERAHALLERPLDADTAVRIALVGNRELRAQLRELGISAGQLLTAGTLANPTVELELLPERDSRYEIRAEYDLSSLILAPIGRGAAQAHLEAARLRAAAAVVELGYTTRTRFYALQATVERLQLAKQALDALAAARDAAQALVDAGNIRALDAASQIAAHARMRANVASLELEVAQRREDMQRTLGVFGDATTWQLASSLPDAPAQDATHEDVERDALAASLELRAFQQTLTGLAKQSQLVSTRAWLPEIAVDVHALRTRGESAGASDAWRWGAGVSAQLPIFDRGQGRLLGIEAQFDAALERYHGLAVDVRSAARDARNHLVSAHARALQFQNVIVPAQRTVLEQTLLQYNAMQVGIFHLLQARRELLDAELARVDVVRDYWSAVAELRVLHQGGRVRASAPSETAMTMTAPTEGH